MTRSVLYKNFTLYFYEITFVILLYGSTTVIRTKRYFSTQVNNYKISVTNSKFKTTDVILMCLEILLYKHKAVIKVSGIVKQTVNRK